MNNHIDPLPSGRRLALILVGLCALCIGCGSKRAATASLHGRVDLAGAADHGSVLVSAAGLSAQVSSAGTFELKGVPVGPVAITAQAPSTLEGAVTALADASKGGDIEVPPLVMTPVGTISGQVLGGTGRTISVAVLGTSAVATADASGSFKLSRVPAGHRTLVASAGGLSTTAELEVAYATETAAPALNLSAPTGGAALSGTARLTGLTDSQGITVVLAGPSSAVAVTDASGAYSFSGLPDGNYSLTATAASTVEASQTASVAVVAGTAAAKPSFAFTPAGTIQGTVSMGAAGSSDGILVIAQGTSCAAVTDATGRFVLRGVPAGPVSLRAEKAGYAGASASPISVAYGQQSAAATIALAPLPSASGPVAGAALIPGVSHHAGTTVSLTPGELQTTTADDGSFRFNAVPVGLYRAEFHNGPYSATVRSLLVLSDGTGWVVDGQIRPLGPISLLRGFSAQAAVASPDGSAVFFGSEGTLMRMPAAGGAAVPVASGGASVAFFSPSGKTAFLLAPTGLTASLLAVPTVGGLATSVVQGIPLRFDWGAADFTPDGKLLLLRTLVPGAGGSSRLWQYWVAPADGSAQAVPVGSTRPEPWAIPRPIFSADSRRALLLEQPANLVGIDLINDTLAVLDAVDPHATRACCYLSADSSRVVYQSPSGVSSIAFAGGAPTSLVAGGSIAAAGAGLLAVQTPSGLQAVSFSGSQPAAAVVSASPAAGSPLVVTSDAHLAFLGPAANGAQPLLSWSPSAGLATLASLPASAWFGDAFVVGPDGSTLLFAAAGGGFSAVSAAGGAPWSVPGLPYSYGWGWPDQSSYVASDGKSQYLVDLRARRALPFDLGATSSMLTPDFAALVFQVPSGNTQALKVLVRSTGAITTLTSDGSSWSASQTTPSLAFIAGASSSPTLQAFSWQSGTTVTLAADPTLALLRVTGSQVLFLGGRDLRGLSHLQVVPLAGGNPQLLGAGVIPPSESAAISTSRSGLLTSFFTLDTDGRTTLWASPTNGSSPSIGLWSGFGSVSGVTFLNDQLLTAQADDAQAPLGHRGMLLSAQ